MTDVDLPGCNPGRHLGRPQASLVQHRIEAIEPREGHAAIESIGLRACHRGLSPPHRGTPIPAERIEGLTARLVHRTLAVPVRLGLALAHCDANVPVML